MASKRTRAPEFPEHLKWFNVDSAISLREQQGRVILLHFGSYCSIHCQHVIADLAYLENKYRQDLLVIGIHGPRFPGELSNSHVQKAINRNHVRHPVINDPGLQISRHYGIHGGPVVVLIDTEGYILGAVSGEGKRGQLDKLVGRLLYQGSRTATGQTTSCTPKLMPEPACTLLFPGKILATEKHVFIADSGHNRILMTSPQGHVLHQFGNHNAGFVDGSASGAAFNNPQGMALADDYLYVADCGNHAIRRLHIHSDDVVTIAGTGRMGTRPDSEHYTSPRGVNLNSPSGLAIKGNDLYIAMTGLHQIWLLSLVTNTLQLFAGSGREDLVDGASRKAAFAQPSALAILGNTLYVADADSSAIRAVELHTRHVTTVVGRGLRHYGNKDGSGSDARFQYPLDIHADPQHRLLWIADTYNSKIRRIETNNNMVSSVPLLHRLNEPAGLAFHGNTLYIANTNHHEIIRVNLRNGTFDALHVDDENIGL
jgi:DNA-binding beta-propeller fold protein YncE